MNQPFEAKGVVKSYNPQTGYGFVVPARKDIGDIFLHRRCLEEIGRSNIDRGTKVVVMVEFQKHKPRVKHIIAVR